MPRITSAQISNFKGITSAEIEPGGINIITGKNNSGKTTLLEALNLCLDPRKIQRYNSHLHEIIHVSAESAEIVIESREAEKSLKIRKPSPDQAIEFFFDSLEQRLDQINERHLKFYLESVDISEFEKFNEELVESLRKTVAELSANEVEDIQESSIILDIDGEEYPYVYYGRKMERLLSENQERITRRLTTEDDLTEAEREKYSSYLDEVFHLTHRIQRNEGFVREKPPTSSVSYIEQPKIGRAPRSQEENAVKKVRVRKYLQEWGILENLESFDFDDLVFNEEDGEKSIPYDFMGEGFKTIVGILWEFVGEEETSDIMLLEEPENHLHPGYVNELVPFLIKIVREEDIQLFLTTHNIDFITEFMSDNISDENREFLRENLNLIQMGGLVPKQFDYEEMEKQIEEVHNDLRGI